MTFVAIWKTSSIVLTGLFGILGLLTEFKDKDTKKVTRWGYISMLGIIVSTILGAGAQVLETQDDANKALKLATESQKMLSGIQQVGKSSQQTLNGIERTLTPLDIESVSVRLKLDCSDPIWVHFCEGARRSSYPERWNHYPGRLPAEDGVKVSIFKDPGRIDKFLEGGNPNDTDIEFDVSGSADPKVKTLYHTTAPGEEVHAGKEQWVRLFIDRAHPANLYSSGAIRSVKDLEGATILVSSGGRMDTYEVQGIHIKTKQGQEVESLGPFKIFNYTLDKNTSDAEDDRAYYCVFKKEDLDKPSVPLDDFHWGHL